MKVLRMILVMLFLASTSPIMADVNNEKNLIMVGDKTKQYINENNSKSVILIGKSAEKFNQESLSNAEYFGNSKKEHLSRFDLFRGWLSDNLAGVLFAIIHIGQFILLVLWLKILSRLSARWL